MDFESYAFNGVIIHNILLRLVTHEETSKDQLWFQIREHLTCLSIGEWCLVTRLFGGFWLMFIIYLMFRLRLDFSGIHGQYFRKKIVVDIFNGDIRI